jgi:hypothetical protein
MVLIYCFKKIIPLPSHDTQVRNYVAFLDGIIKNITL